MSFDVILIFSFFFLPRGYRANLFKSGVRNQPHKHQHKSVDVSLRYLVYIYATVDKLSNNHKPVDFHK